MGVFNISCPTCSTDHLWWSGSLDQRCLKCRTQAVKRDRGSPQAELLGLRPQIYAFALLMERKLQTNDGIKRHWSESGLSATFGHFIREVEELRDELMGQARKGEITAEAADVASLAMMIADLVGGLDETLEDVARSTARKGSEGSQAVVSVADGAEGASGFVPDLRDVRRAQDGGGPP